LQGYEQSSCHKCLKIFTDVPANLGERKLKKLKQRICCQKPLPLFFSLSGLPTFWKEKQIMFWRSMRILTLYIKKRARKRGLVQGGMT
jgi:hypothetical protein